MINAGAEPEFALVAGSQSGGRGQFGRSFFSPPTGLYLSVCLLRPGGINNSFITQATALAVAEAVEELYRVRLEIKPVNDLIYEGAKVGGILVESVALPGSEGHFAIFGVGLNLCRPKEGFPSELDKIAGYIFGSEIDKNSLVKAIIASIKRYTTDPREEEILEKYLSRAIKIER